MWFVSGCKQSSFALPWRTLLPYLVALHLLELGSGRGLVGLLCLAQVLLWGTGAAIGQGGRKPSTRPHLGFTFK